MSVVVLKARAKGEQLQEGVACHADGTMTTDPKVVLEQGGFIIPFGGHKVTPPSYTHTHILPSLHCLEDRTVLLKPHTHTHASHWSRELGSV